MHTSILCDHLLELIFETHGNKRKTKLYLLYCAYAVKHPTQVTVFNICRMPKIESESVLNYEVFRAGLVMVMASDMLSHPPWHIRLSSESWTEVD